MTFDREDDKAFDMAAEYAHLDELGLLDEGQPTRYGYYWQQRRAQRALRVEFTPAERAMIRSALGRGRPRC